MVALDDDVPPEAADAPTPAWLDSLGLWRDGLDQATTQDVRRMVVSRLDPPLSRRLTGEMEVISVVPDAGAPPEPRGRETDHPYRQPQERSYERYPLEHPSPSQSQPGLLPTTPMLSMTSGHTPTTSGETPVVDLPDDFLGPTGRVVRRPTRPTRAQRTAGVRRRRLGRLGTAAGLLVAVAFAWFVLVSMRAPSSEDAPVDRIGARIDGTLLDTLLADRLQAFVGWIASVSTTLVLGGVIFQLFVAGSRALPQARSARSATGHSAGLSVLRKAAIVGILAELVSLLLRAAALSSDGFEAMRDADTLRFVMAGRFGDAAFLRIAGLALLAGFLPVLPIGPASRRPEPVGSGREGRRLNGVNGYGGAGRNGHPAHSSEVLGRRRIYARQVGGTTSGQRMWLERLVCVVGGLVVLLSYAIVGHPQATQPAALFVPVQCVHIVAASTWFGGVAFLAIELRQQKREGTARDFAEVVRRFSTVAGAMIALLGVTGLLMANSQLDSINALRETAYGRALMVKMLVLAVPVAVGGYNRQRVVPAIVNRDEASAWRHLRITLGVESVVIALGVLLATAAMTSGGFQ